MAIPTRQQWVKKRDAVGGSAGMVKQVSIGKLLDEYDRAAKKSPSSTFQATALATSKELTALWKGLKTYRAGLPNNKTALIAYVDQLIAELDAMVRRGERLANPVLDVRDHTQRAVAISQAVMTSGDRAAYSKMYQVNIRGAGAAWATLVKLEPGLKPLYDKLWAPLCAPGWAGSGAETGANLTDAAEADRALKAAAQKVNTRGVKLLTELRKHNVIH
jgi:hypothetical protein